jgi:Fe-S oxidoreductase
MSRAIAGLLFDQVEGSPGDRVVAPGTSCRSQLLEQEGRDSKPPHPIQALDDALVE